MRNDNYYLLTFNSTHFAIAAEKYLSKAIPVTIMPTLRSITASCGISIRIETNDFITSLALIKKNSKILSNCQLYKIEDDNIISLTTKDPQ